MSNIFETKLWFTDNIVLLRGWIFQINIANVSYTNIKLVESNIGESDLNAFMGDNASKSENVKVLSVHQGLIKLFM